MASHAHALQCVGFAGQSRAERNVIMKFTYSSGSRPLDGYTIKRGIGQGGFGEVYYAVSDGGKEVALKLVMRNLDVELRGVAQCMNLKHPNLVTLYDLRTNDVGEHFVVMEYVSGKCLADLLEGLLLRHALREAVGTHFDSQAAEVVGQLAPAAGLFDVLFDQRTVGVVIFASRAQAQQAHARTLEALPDFRAPVFVERNLHAVLVRGA